MKKKPQKKDNFETELEKITLTDDNDKIITLLEKILTQLTELNSKTSKKIDTSVFHDYTK